MNKLFFLSSRWILESGEGLDVIIWSYLSHGEIDWKYVQGVTWQKVLQIQALEICSWDFWDQSFSHLHFPCSANEKWACDLQWKALWDFKQLIELGLIVWSC
jgi:hypothetical protein